jgi:hypothetical protein
MAGKRGIGIDLNPVAAAISRAKVASASIDRVERLLRKALSGTPKDVPEGEFWEHCFHRETLREVCSLREFLRVAQGDAADILRAVALGLLHGPQSKIGSYFSNQMPRTYATKPEAALRFWRKHRMRPRRVDVAELIRRRLTYVLADVPPSSGGRVFCDDALALLPKLRIKADLVITSPPYAGLRTYVSDQWLRLWFLGGPPTVIYRCPGQLGVENEETFGLLLARMLTALESATNDSAHAYMLLGSIPSRPIPVPQVMAEAVRASNSSWRIVSRRNYGHADAGKRQARQFVKRSQPAEEFLFHLARAP